MDAEWLQVLVHSLGLSFILSFCRDRNKKLPILGLKWDYIWITCFSFITILSVCFSIGSLWLVFKNGTGLFTLMETVIIPSLLEWLEYLEQFLRAEYWLHGLVWNQREGFSFFKSKWEKNSSELGLFILFHFFCKSAFLLPDFNPLVCIGPMYS